MQTNMVIVHNTNFTAMIASMTSVVVCDATSVCQRISIKTKCILVDNLMLQAFLYDEMGGGEMEQIITIILKFIVCIFTFILCNLVVIGSGYVMARIVAGNQIGWGCLI